MKAMRLPTFGGPETLVYEDAPDPHPREGEILIRVYATAITPTEFAWEPTWHTRTGAARPFPIIFGHGVLGCHCGNRCRCYGFFNGRDRLWIKRLVR